MSVKSYELESIYKRLNVPREDWRERLMLARLRRFYGYEQLIRQVRLWQEYYGGLFNEVAVGSGAVPRGVDRDTGLETQRTAEPGALPTGVSTSHEAAD